ncbi:MAG: phosphopantetheine-binding protein [Ktedonobacteraceae bacterium]
MSNAKRIYAAPRTPIEEILVRIWTQVLGCEHIGIKDHFQDLGGTSLHATRIFSRLRDDLGIHFPRSLILEVPTIAQMAAYIETTCHLETRSNTITTVTHTQGKLEDMPSSFPQ